MAVRLLLIEDNPGDAVIFQEKIDASPLDAALVHVVRLQEALDRLSSDAFDLVLVDLSLPDAQGLEAVERVRAAAPHLPLIVLTGLDDATAAAEAKKRGAVDYLVKWYVDSASLARYIRYAMEQYRLLGPEQVSAPSSRGSAPRRAVAPARRERVPQGRTAEPEGDGMADTPTAAAPGGFAAPEGPAALPPIPGAGDLAPALEAALDVATGMAIRAEHLAGSLRAALDFARTEGEARAPEALDVVPLVQQAVDRARTRALHQGIPVRLQNDRKKVLAAVDRPALVHALERVLALALDTGCGSGIHLAARPEGGRTTLRVVWELRERALLPASSDPLRTLDLDLCSRLAARAGGSFTLRVDGVESSVVLAFDAPARG